MNPAIAIQRNRWIDLVFHLIVAVTAFHLKSFYSHAGSEDLTWILRPTAMMAESFSGLGFLPETGAGFVSGDRRFVIAPACAGVNFLIIAFVMAAVSGMHRFRGASGKSLWLILSAVSAFGLTVGVNGVRVAVSIQLYEAGIRIGPLTPDRLHRIAGATVYLSGLFLYHGSISRALNRRGHGSKAESSGNGRMPWRAGLPPLFWYLAVALGIPLIHALRHGSPERFIEHAGTVLAVSIGVFTLVSAAQWGCHRLRKRLRFIRMPSA